MPTYKIRGIDVNFPYEAYDCQIVYMEKVIRSLQEKCTALLESPTGTGKTLCLLCATLAWRKSLGPFSTKLAEGKIRNFGSKNGDISLSQQERPDLPTIIYTSRTHSQLQQVIRELKASSYRPKMAVLGSREQMCIHNDVQILRGRAQNNACQSLCKRRACFHHTRVSDYIKSNPDLGNEPFDIEDLVNIGRNQGPCPYYVSRELHKVVDILFAPYNYLIDEGNRRSLSGIQWDNTVLIFDEAHNLESICADAASFDLPSAHLAACISEAKQCVDLSLARREIDKLDDKSLDPDNFAILRALLLKLEKRIEEVPIESKELGFTKPGPYIYELLADLNITYETANMLMNTIDQAALLLEDAASTAGNGPPNKTKGTVCRLESMRDILKIVFKDGDKSHAKYYRVHVQESQANATDVFRGKASRTLSWWCFNPGIAMEAFVKLGVHSIIVTSGTLSPLNSFALELNIEFPVRLENPHVISSDQVWVGVVATGPSGCSFNSSYRNRDSIEYKQDLGNAIVNFARIVPDGLLVFFPSYYLMDQCIECWKNVGHASGMNSNTIWERICKLKQPVVEPKQSALFPYSIEDFRTKLIDSSTSGAIFFAVCRGKVSEGLDFADHAGRAVVVTGIPFAMRNDPKIRLKREFLDQQILPQKKDVKGLTGEEWYSQQAARAVNQAVGRVIRHRHDYGAIIFCDERFAPESRQSQMSLWLRPHVKCYPKFGDVVYTLTKFFRERGMFCPKPKPTPFPSNNNADEVNFGNFQDKKFSAKTLKPLAALTGEEGSRKTLSSRHTANRGSPSHLLGVVAPANRSTLTDSRQTHCSTLKHLRDLFGHQNSFQADISEKKGSQHKDSEVVDLTSSSPSNELQSAKDMLKCCSAKTPKKLKVDPDTIQISGNSDSCVRLCNVGSDHSPNSSSFMGSSLRQCEKESRSSQFGPTEACTSSNDRSAGHSQASSNKATQKAELTIAGTCNNEEARGSAFLIQVKEKLTASEYRDFVGFMKALKSKTMTITPVLEAIVRLFSSPGRVDLLKRFKDYVPVKYRHMYEQHLITLDAAFGSEEEPYKS